MPSCQIDHLTITAANLEVGIDLVRRLLGVIPQTGGEHPRMGTHNALLRLGDSLFLEVIAINPKAPKPERARWFDLDRQADAPPRFATWVARTDDIRLACAASSEPLGAVVPLSRGDLRWLMAIADDGRLPFDGIAPTLIEWQTQGHVATRLQDVGCRLVGLEGFHPEAGRINAQLRSLAMREEVAVSALPRGERPYLVAHIHTPSGLKTLSGRQEC